MHVVGELQLDFVGYRRLNQSAIGAKIWTCRGLGLIALILGIVELTVRGDTSAGTIMLLMLGPLFLVLCDLMVVIGWRRVSSLTASAWRYEITDGTIRIRTPQTDVTTRWDGVTKVSIRRYAWMLRLATKQRIPIPRTAFSPADATRIDSLVDSVCAK